MQTNGMDIEPWFSPLLYEGLTTLGVNTSTLLSRQRLDARVVRSGAGAGNVREQIPIEQFLYQ